jgi:predicted lipid-binding transport protein (Tim44 family)
MKALLTIAALLGFTAFASAQEVQDRMQQQPPPVTQAQVERDAQLAAEQRQKNEEARKAQQKALKKEAEKATADNAATINNRKSSTRPEQ